MSEKEHVLVLVFRRPCSIDQVVVPGQTTDVTMVIGKKLAQYADVFDEFEMKKIREHSGRGSAQ